MVTTVLLANRFSGTLVRPVQSIKTESKVFTPVIFANSPPGTVFRAVQPLKMLLTVVTFVHLANTSGEMSVRAVQPWNTLFRPDIAVVAGKTFAPTVVNDVQLLKQKPNVAFAAVMNPNRLSGTDFSAVQPQKTFVQVYNLAAEPVSMVAGRDSSDVQP